MLIPIIIIVLSALLLAFVICGLYNPLTVSQLTVRSAAITAPVRIALVSDLHSCQYGDHQAELTDAIHLQKPDLICLAGDIFDNKLPDDNTAFFLAALSGKYPCYYVTGNHEYYAGPQAFREKMEIAERYGVIRLSNESKALEIRGQKITICGVDDPVSVPDADRQYLPDALRRIRQGLHGSSYTLLLSHRPEFFSAYVDCGFDLTLCGHAHGGQWRIPGLLRNGLFAPHQGLFPKYTTGKYSSGNAAMIVSRGLSRERTIVPRFYNRPEIVMIELQPEA